MASEVQPFGQYGMDGLFYHNRFVGKEIEARA